MFRCEILFNLDDLKDDLKELWLIVKGCNVVCVEWDLF